MRKRLFVRAGVAVSLISVLLVAGPDAGFAHGQVTGAPSTSHSSGPAAVLAYEDTLMYINHKTGGCISDNKFAGVAAEWCADFSEQRWGFTFDWNDDSGNQIGTLQNMATGSCLDDSVEKGLRGYTCHVDIFDPARAHQQFRRTWTPAGYVLQNMATGSCVDDSIVNGAHFLRGYYCNGLDFQAWWPIVV
jgi:hypothetical protein